MSEHGCRQGDVTPNQRTLWIQSLRVREATPESDRLQPHRLQGRTPEGVGQSRATALGLLRPSGAVAQWPLAGGENRRPPPSRARGHHYGSDITVGNQLERVLTPLAIRPARAFW